MVRTLLLGLLVLPACGARSALLEASDGAVDSAPSPDLARACVSDADCASSDPCVSSTCSPAGSCVERPRAMGQVQEFVVNGLLGAGTSSGARAYGLVRLKDDSFVARPFGLDGPAGSDVALGTVGGNRSWDSVLVPASGGGLALVSVVQGGLELRLSSKPGSKQRLDPGGIFVEAAATGSRLVAVSDRTDSCAVAWADTQSGTWTSKLLSSGQGCVYASLPNPLQPNVVQTGLPPAREPVGFTAQGAAIVLSVASDGKGVRLTAAPDGTLQTDGFSLASPGLKYFHSLVAKTGGGGVGAAWCRTEHGDSPTTQVNLALLDRTTLKPLGPVSTRVVKGRPYAPKMDMVWCEGRYVAFWYDEQGGAAWQLGPDGQPLGQPLRFASPLKSALIAATCIDHGVVLFTHDRAVTLRCPAP